MKLKFKTEVPKLEELNTVLSESFSVKYKVFNFTFGVKRVIVKKKQF